MSDQSTCLNNTRGGGGCSCEVCQLCGVPFDRTSGVWIGDQPEDGPFESGVRHFVCAICAHGGNRQDGTDGPMSDQSLVIRWEVRRYGVLLTTVEAPMSQRAEDVKRTLVGRGYKPLGLEVVNGVVMDLREVT